MTRLVRALSMTVGLLLLLHVAAMAVDPVGMHAGADAPVPSLTGHKDDGAADSSLHAAHAAYASTQAAETCLDAVGVAAQPRVSLDPVAFVAVLPSSMGETVPTDHSFHLSWIPPVLDGKEIRILLQVFLN